MNTIQKNVAVVIAVIAVSGIAAVCYLAFIFPKTLEIWNEQGRALSIVEQLTANLSMFCRQFGIVLLPLLLLVFFGCVIWAGVSMHRRRKEDEPSTGAKAASAHR